MRSANMCTIDIRKMCRENGRSKTICILTIYCVSGSLLTVYNKAGIKIFPFPNLLLVLQNLVTLMLLMINYYFSTVSFPPITLSIIKLWIPIVSLFIVMLLSSLCALTYVSVPTVIVIRNLSTLLVALLEYLILGDVSNGLSISAMLGMLLGAVFYALHDLTFSIQGYVWLSINVIGTSIYQVYIKKIINMSVVKDSGSIGMSYYNNLISLPILIILAFATDEVRRVWVFNQTVRAINFRSVLIVFTSCVLGFTLSVSAFALNKLISATSIMVANNVNKFTLIVLSEIFIEITLDLKSSVGAIFVILFGWLYSKSKANNVTSLVVRIVVIFVCLCIILEARRTISSLINTISTVRFLISPPINAISLENTLAKTLMTTKTTSNRQYFLNRTISHD